MRGRAPAAVVRAVFLSQCASRKGWPSLSVRFAQGALARLFSPPAHPMPGAPRRRPAACRPVRPPPGGGSHPQAARIRPVRFAHCPAGVPAGVRASPAPQGRPQLPAVQGQGNRGPFRFAPIGGCAPDTPEPAGRQGCALPAPGSVHAGFFVFSTCDLTARRPRSSAASSPAFFAAPLASEICSRLASSSRAAPSSRDCTACSAMRALCSARRAALASFSASTALACACSRARSAPSRRAASTAADCSAALRCATQTKVYSVRLVPVCLARFTRKTNPVSDCFAQADNLHT